MSPNRCYPCPRNVQSWEEQGVCQRKIDGGAWRRCHLCRTDGLFRFEQIIDGEDTNHRSYDARNLVLVPLRVHRTYEGYSAAFDQDHKGRKSTKKVLRKFTVKALKNGPAKTLISSAYTGSANAVVDVTNASSPNRFFERFLDQCHVSD